MHNTETNGNIGNIKYTFLGSNEAEHLNKPLEVIKLKWGNLEPNSIYLIRISCGSTFIALVQTFGQLTHGSVLITSYGFFNPVYAVLRNTVWTETSLITNSDLGIVYHPNITIPGTKAAIENYIKTNTGTLKRFNTVRSDPSVDAENGFFPGKTSFCILWQCSSTAYGWIIIYSDAPGRPVIHGILSSNTFTWYTPALTQI